MTDQEGGTVRRLPGPPTMAASAMGSSNLAFTQGIDTGRLLRSAGVNVDLAPVADVNQANGFMEQEQRSFGDTPSVVANASCAFANALAGDGVAYTLKHFPGLGDALTSTDIGPVSVSASAADINASDAAYRMCGDNKLALVMISSASYPNLTGSSPAVLAPETYQKVIKQDGINAVLISDSFESGAVKNQVHPALKALNDGLDMVMYPDLQSYAEFAYASLLKDARQGILSRSRITAAVNRVLELKRSLGLSAG
jgi:beta-N-acetylhexosaminidase